MKGLSVFLLVVVIFFASMAHEEPAKTMYEKKEKEKTAKKWSDFSVRKSVAWKYSSDQDKNSETGIKVLVQEYDRSGRLVGLESYRNDSLKLVVKYEFDSSGNMVSDIDYLPDGKMQEKNTFVYDQDGRVVSGKSFDQDDQLTGYFIINKAEDKKSIEFIKFKTNDSLDYKIEYMYTTDFDQSDYTEAKKCSAGNQLQLRVTKKHNTAGLATEKAVFGSDSNLSYTFFYEYDENGNTLKISKQLQDGLTEWFDLYLYNLNNLCGEVSSFDSSGTLKSTIKYTYEYVDE